MISPKPCLTESISITRERGSIMHITSKAPFFGNEITVEVTDEALVFRLAGIDDRVRKKPCVNRGRYHLSVNGECKTGRFVFDEEESNEDMLVVYCRN